MRYANSKEYKNFIWKFLEELYKTFKVEFKDLLDSFKRAVEEKMLTIGMISQPLPPPPKM